MFRMVYVHEITELVAAETEPTLDLLSLTYVTTMGVVIHCLIYKIFCQRIPSIFIKRVELNSKQT